MLIERWKQVAVNNRRKGFVDATVAEITRVSIEKLKTNLRDDPEFRAAYQEAAANARKLPQF